MKVIDINYPSGVAEARGVTRNIGLQLLPENNVNIGDYVIVHVGFAIEKLDREEADEIWKGFDELLRLMDEEDEGA
jgi:hydrogenase expression/formation protein HypC